MGADAYFASQMDALEKFLNANDAEVLRYVRKIKSGQPITDEDTAFFASFVSVPKSELDLVSDIP